MADTKGSPGSKNSAGTGKPSSLPPKTPVPVLSPSYCDYTSTHCLGLKGIPKTREGLKHHQRTCSESFLIEEQPSWIDDLLNEPEAPVRRAAHRRSSSDSFMYLDASNLSLDKLTQDGYKHQSIESVPSWGSGDFDYLSDGQYPAYCTESNSTGGFQNRGWDSPLNMVTCPSDSHLSTKEKITHPGLSCVGMEPGLLMSTQDQKSSFERREISYGKNPQSEIDNKRVKQQFAQRSRVRKLQYIAELESTVQVLQAEGLEVSAEVEFLNQQNLMLDLENKALNQRLESLGQEHLIKCLQHEMWEREIARLRALLFQQQQQQPTSTHGRRNSRDLDSQFATLSLKHQEANSARDPVNGQLHI